MSRQKKDKKSPVQEILESIEDKDENNKLTLHCLACLARNLKQQEEVLQWIKKQSRLPGYVLIGGNIAIFIIFNYLIRNAGNQMPTSFIIVFMILIEAVVVGIFLLTKREIFRQMGIYQANLHEDKQFWIIAGLITKTKDETELYECMIESEIRRREKEKHQK